MAIRGGNGLGDAIYVQSIARHLLKKGNAVEVCTRWPDVFSQLDGAVRTSPFRRDRITHLAHYTARKGMAGTSQFQDCCYQAGIHEPVQLCLGWRITEPDLAARVRGDGLRPVIGVSVPRTPMGRTDGFGKEVLPDCRVIQKVIDAMGHRARFVQVGGGHPLFRFGGIDLDLVNKTTVPQLFDVASACDGFLGYCSFLVPLAEALDRPSLWIWSRRGLTCSTAYVRRIAPQKVLHSVKSQHIVDDATQKNIEAAAAEFLISC